MDKSFFLKKILTKSKSSNIFLLYNSSPVFLFKTAKFLIVRLLSQSQEEARINNFFKSSNLFEIGDFNKEVSKKDIFQIVEKLSFFPLDPKKPQICVIYGADKIQKSVSSSFFKFLERQNQKIYAFFLTTSIDSVDPLLISHCLCLPLHEREERSREPSKKIFENYHKFFSMLFDFEKIKKKSFFLWIDVFKKFSFFEKKSFIDLFLLSLKSNKFNFSKQLTLKILLLTLKLKNSIIHNDKVDFGLSCEKWGIELLNLITGLN